MVRIGLDDPEVPQLMERIDKIEQHLRTLGFSQKSKKPNIDERVKAIEHWCRDLSNRLYDVERKLGVPEK